MADAINVSNLRTALASVSSYPLLVRTPRTAGYHKIVAMSSSTVLSDRIYPSSSNGSDSWLVLTLEPLMAEGEAAGSLLGRPSTTLPQLGGIATAGDLTPLLTAIYNSYKVAVGDDSGVYLCEAPVRVSVTTEYGVTNRTAAVLQLF
jgi:hypothetical protein